MCSSSQTTSDVTLEEMVLAARPIDRLGPRHVSDLSGPLIA